jgi:sulfoxide reductase catalytic subunit YedY
MLVKRVADTDYSEVTPKKLYLNRRQILAGVSGLVLGAGALLSPSRAEADTPVKLSGVTKSAFSTTEKETPYNDVTTYNNFYEFGTDKGDPSKDAKDFRTSP